MQGPAPVQMGPAGEAHRGVSSLGQTGELWALARHQHLSRGLSRVGLLAALRWLTA